MEGLKQYFIVFLVLILAQTSFALVQENMLIVFPELAGEFGFLLGFAGFAVIALLLILHVIKGIE